MRMHNVSSSISYVTAMDDAINDSLMQMCSFVKAERSRMIKLLAEEKCTHMSALHRRLLSGLDGGSHQCPIQDVQEIRSYLWERLHITHWKDVHEIYREMFAIATFLLVCKLVKTGFENANDLARLLDSGLLLGCSRASSLLSSLLSSIVDVSTGSGTGFWHARCANLPRAQLQSAAHKYRIRQAQQRMNTLTSTGNSSGGKLVQRIPAPDVYSFFERYFKPEEPVVLVGAMEDWTATYTWGNIEYILDVLGHRTVPIETGKNYLSEESGSTFISGEKFVFDYIIGATQVDASTVGVNGDTPPPMGYLAQHQLLEQVPALKRDIITPDYCALLLDIDEQQSQAVSPVKQDGDRGPPQDSDPSAVLVNAWLGPVGTVSPLHHDPYYNILAQVTGYKYVRLYHPDQSAKLYSMSGRMTNNSSFCDSITNLHLRISRVDLLRPWEELLAEFPQLGGAEYSEHVLAPGEIMFIPRWHWHFIVAIDEATALRWRRERLDVSPPTVFTAAVPTASVVVSDVLSYARDEVAATPDKLTAPARLPLRLPTPVCSGEDGPFESDVIQSLQESAIAVATNGPLLGCDHTAQVGKKRVSREILNEQQEQDICEENNARVDYSFSVSFWWGARILQDYCN